MIFLFGYLIDSKENNIGFLNLLVKMLSHISPHFSYILSIVINAENSPQSAQQNFSKKNLLSEISLTLIPIKKNRK